MKIPINEILPLKKVIFLRMSLRNRENLKIMEEGFL